MSDPENEIKSKNSPHVRRYRERPSVSVLHRGGSNAHEKLNRNVMSPSLKKSDSNVETFSPKPSVSKDYKGPKLKIRSRSSDCLSRSGNRVFVSQIKLDLINKNGNNGSHTPDASIKGDGLNVNDNKHICCKASSSNVDSTIVPCACSQYTNISVHEMHKCIFLCNEKDTSGKIFRRDGNPNSPYYVMTTQSRSTTRSLPRKIEINNELENKETQTSFLYYVEQPMLDIAQKSYSKKEGFSSDETSKKKSSKHSSRKKKRSKPKSRHSVTSSELSKSDLSDTNTYTKKSSKFENDNKTSSSTLREKHSKTLEASEKRDKSKANNDTLAEEVDDKSGATEIKERKSTRSKLPPVKKSTSRSHSEKLKDKSSVSPSLSDTLLDQPMSEIQKLLDSLNAQLQIKDSNVNYSTMGDTKQGDIFWENPLKPMQEMHGMYTPVVNNRSASQVSRQSHRSMAGPNSELEPIYDDIHFESPEPTSKQTPRLSSIKSLSRTPVKALEKSDKSLATKTAGNLRSRTIASDSPEKVCALKFVRTFDLDPYDEMVKSHKNCNDRRLKAVASKNGCNICIEGPVRVYDNNQTCVAMRNKTCYRCYVGSINKEKLEKCVNYLKETFPNTFLKVKV